MIVIIRDLGQSEGKSLHTNKTKGRKLLTLKITPVIAKALKLPKK
jgi:hypothetical protein